MKKNNNSRIVALAKAVFLFIQQHFSFKESQVKTVIFTSHPDLSCCKQVFTQSLPENIKENYIDEALSNSLLLNKMLTKTIRSFTTNLIHYLLQLCF